MVRMLDLSTPRASFVAPPDTVQVLPTGNAGTLLLGKPTRRLILLWPLLLLGIDLHIRSK